MTNVHLRRELRAVLSVPHLPFWIIICNGLFDIAVLEWCKLFGSDDEEKQPVHWKNNTSDVSRFRSDLLSRLQISAEEWTTYWATIKRYRDQAIAHHDPKMKEIPNYPIFDLALQSAYFYYDFAVQELSKLGIEQHPRDLERYGEAFAEQCKPIAAAAVQATRIFAVDILE